MDPINEAYQKATQPIKEGARNLQYNGQEKPIKFKKTITITVEAQVVKNKYIDRDNPEAGEVEGLVDCEVKYNTDKLQEEIADKLIPEISKAVGDKIVYIGGSAMIGFPTHCSNEARVASTQFGHLIKRRK